MNNINLNLSEIFKNNIVSSIIVIILSLAIYRIINKIFFNNKNSNKIKQMSNKSKTYLRMTTSIIRYVFILFTILIILQINGVDVSSMLAGVGILGIIVGLAVQDALKDIIKGMNILSDKYFQVGDVIKYNEIEGKVLTIGLKTTRIQDILTSNIISIANRNIEQVEIVSKFLYVNVPMDYEVPLEKAENVVNNIVNIISKHEEVELSNYIGITNLDDSFIRHTIQIVCNAEKKLKIRNLCYKIILEEFAKNNIQVPYNQIDVHTK